MNVAARIPATIYEAVPLAEGSYIMTEDDFLDEPWLEREDGVWIATGICKRGDAVTTPLNVPLCQGCDQRIIDHKCDDCELVFTA